MQIKRRHGADVEALRAGLAHGMGVVELPTFEDDRGSLQELFRSSWPPGLEPVQWNCVRSLSGIMRGMHVHLGYTEYYVVLAGLLLVGWRDARAGSPSENEVGLFEVRAEDRIAVFAPTGICHGLYFPEPTTLLIGTTAEWDLANEIGCHWQDPELGIPWPFDEARISERDAAQPPLSAILDHIPAWHAP